MKQPVIRLLLLYIMLFTPVFLAAQNNIRLSHQSNNHVFINPDNNLAYIQPVSVPNTNPAVTEPTEPVNVIVTQQIAFSPIIGALFACAGAAAGYAIDISGNHDDFDGLVGLVFGGGLGYLTGMTFGVYKIGQRNGLEWVSYYYRFIFHCWHGFRYYIKFRNRQ